MMTLNMLIVTIIMVFALTAHAFHTSKTRCVSLNHGIKPHVLYASTPTSPTQSATTKDLQTNDNPWTELLLSAWEIVFLPSTVETVVQLCDRVDNLPTESLEKGIPQLQQQLKDKLLRYKRSSILSSILKENRESYLATANFLANRIPRNELPNLQDLPPKTTVKGGKTISDDATSTISLVVPPPDSNMQGMVADCVLPNVTYSESLLDQALLAVFRSIVQKEIQWRSDTKGIKGLLEEGRHYMLSPEGTPDNQHAFVRRTLGALLTPFLPPFYRIFMAGIVPSLERGDPPWLVDLSRQFIQLFPQNVQQKMTPGTQLGPLFYAPALTAVVTPPFLNFLVGPSRVNLRKDGSLGGMVVEKCKVSEFSFFYVYTLHIYIC